MPQMKPLNWLILFFYFSLVFIFLNSINYFNILYKNNKIFKTHKNINIKAWMW
uniref:ATP synthase complex subunit 8 n=1 Tax=Byrrhus sp. MJTNT-2012 TaxID=1131599 RepID=H6W8L2_9COLE|nr:ATP synthase F0 subunit 8 [Byrrhus sp. MJTNT-2012]